MITINEYGEFISAVNKHDICLVKIGTTWCGPCKTVQKNIEDIEKNYNNVYFIDVDAEEADEIVEEFGVRNIPVVLVIKDGRVVSKTVGLQSQADLENRLRFTTTG